MANIRKGQFFLKELCVLVALEDADDCSYVKAKVVRKYDTFRENELGYIGEYWTIFIYVTYNSLSDALGAVQKRMLKTT